MMLATLCGLDRTSTALQSKLDNSSGVTLKIMNRVHVSPSSILEMIFWLRPTRHKQQKIYSSSLSRSICLCVHTLKVEQATWDDTVCPACDLCDPKMMCRMNDTSFSTALIPISSA
eukprot:1139250-Pelagomonas_calceolata.AAC.10